MSRAEENVAVARRFVELMDEGGSKAVLDRVEEFIDPAWRWTGAAVGRDAPGGDVVYEGYEGVRQFWTDNEEAFDDIHFADTEFESFGDRVVLVRTNVSGTGVESGVRVELPLGIVYEFARGRMVGGENIFDPEEAEKRARALAEEGVDAQA